MDKLTSKVQDQSAAKNIPASNAKQAPLIVEWKLAANDVGGGDSCGAPPSCGGGKDAIFARVDTSVYQIDAKDGAGS